ncbi:hypothetical protein N7456_001020 [Penicillium angulare]|uniref:Short-chain dehydrogenase/reductase SDR n=1 Tax=Penicillium angulare TaxID=116970 RepID=A0A9W9KRG6_9EURO|nr:hypothetical protein N7456_001020 [Penicillium angulare]
MPVYLVTGVGRGLGYALIQTLSKNPENTVIGIARNAAAVKTRIQSDGVNALIFEADLTDQASLSRAAGNIESALGGAGIDVMINNAGYVSDTTALKSLAEFENDVQTAIDDTQKSIGVNVFGTLRAITTFLPLIQRGELKKVIAISSGMGDIEFINETQLPIAAPYAVSKAALTTLMAKFAAAYVDQGILFASICPGRVDTAEPGTSLSSDDITRLEKYGPKFESYSPGFKAMAPEEAARSVMAAIERSSLAEGYSGSFLSHNGTKRWM